MSAKWDTFKQQRRTVSQTIEMGAGMRKNTSEENRDFYEWCIQWGKECLRVLKPGAFAFVMSGARADCLWRMIAALEEAGFVVSFTPIFWAYASGFPHAMNVSKMIDRKLGVERNKGGIRTDGRGKWKLKMNREKGDTGIGHADGSKRIYQEELPTSPEAKALDGAYAGFQPKPAVEVILVAMKPLQKTDKARMALDFTELKEMKKILLAQQR